jgi:hypothetical protein
VEMARCLLQSSKLPNAFWVRALDVAFYITNRCLSSSLPRGKTPFELFHGKVPDLSNLKVFGCSAFRFIETHNPKLQMKSTKEIIVGYGASSSNSYLLYNCDSKRVSQSRNVTFNESELLGLSGNSEEHSSPLGPEEVPSEVPLAAADPPVINRIDVPRVPQAPVQVLPVPPVILPLRNPVVQAAVIPAATRSGRVVKKPNWLSDFVTDSSDLVSDLSIETVECNFGLDSDQIQDTPFDL